MQRLFTLALLGVLAICGVAQGADLPKKEVYKAPAPVATSTGGFFVGIAGGLGLSKTQSTLTATGVAQGGLGAYPTGLQAGGVLGYGGQLGSFYYAATFEGLYDFSQGQVSDAVLRQGGSQVFGPAYRKNGLLLQEGGEFGLSLASITGYVPSAGQPQNWIIPISVPSSVTSNLIFALRGGVAERDISLCGAIDNAGGTACDNKFIVAPYAGIKLKTMLSQNVEAFVTSDYIFWGNPNSSFTPTSSNGLVPTFTANSVSIGNEFVTRVGGAYHF